MIEICLWNLDENGTIQRPDRIPVTIPGITRFQQVELHQGRIGRIFLDSMKERGNLTVERGVLPVSFELHKAKAADFDTYTISAKLRTMSGDEAIPQQQQQHQRSANGGKSVIGDGLFRSNLAADDTEDLIRTATENRDSMVELVKAKFVVGCDGAHPGYDAKPASNWRAIPRTTFGGS